MNFDILELWMIILGLTMSLSGIPQILKSIKLQKTSDVSISTWILIIHGHCWWLYYGIVKNSISLIISCIAGILVDGAVLFLVFKYRKNINIITPSKRWPIISKPII
jgi:uncharacterized protein with PQ loop repeat